MGRREGRFVAVTTEAACQSPERHFKFAHAWRFVCLAGSAFAEEIPSIPIHLIAGSLERDQLSTSSFVNIGETFEACGRSHSCVHIV